MLKKNTSVSVLFLYFPLYFKWTNQLLLCFHILNKNIIFFFSSQNLKVKNLSTNFYNLHWSYSKFLIKISKLLLLIFLFPWIYQSSFRIWDYSTSKPRFLAWIVNIPLSQKFSPFSPESFLKSPPVHSFQDRNRYNFADKSYSFPPQTTYISSQIPSPSASSPPNFSPLSPYCKKLPNNCSNTHTLSNAKGLLPTIFIFNGISGGKGSPFLGTASVCRWAYFFFGDSLCWRPWKNLYCEHGDAFRNIWISEIILLYCTFGAYFEVSWKFKSEFSSNYSKLNKGGKEGGREGGREGRKEGGREGVREGGREGGRKGRSGKESRNVLNIFYSFMMSVTNFLTKTNHLHQVGILIFSP